MSRLSEHRRRLKWRLVGRDRCCLSCVALLVVDRNVHLHEALISKGQMMGLPDKSKIELHCERNAVLLCDECNTSHANAPSRSEAWTYLCRLYGEKGMREWYAEAQKLFKSRLPQFVEVV